MDVFAVMVGFEIGWVCGLAVLAIAWWVCR